MQDSQQKLAHIAIFHIMQAMSEFSHALSKYLSESKITKSSLAETTGLSLAMISRYCSGRYRPEKESLTKLCRSLPDEWAANLCRAHAYDEIPQKIRKKLRISTSEARIKEEPAPSEIAKLDTKTQKAIIYLAMIAREDKNAQDAIISTAKYLGAKI